MDTERDKLTLKRFIADFKKDQIPFNEIDLKIKSGIHLSGSPLLILLFSSLIGSIGLNINSTPMVLGAKLISPLMIMMLGMGFGMATYQYDITKVAFKYLLIQCLIILVTSTIYFTLSPIKTPTTELITKTNVSVFDICVAFFGGTAAVIANTRFERYNVLPGVALATSLVPPACTIGYGIANRNPNFIFPPLYLFLLNVVFLTFSMFVGFKIISRNEISKREKRMSFTKQAIYIAITLLIAVPVLFSSIFRIRDNYLNSIDKSNMYEYIKNELNLDNSTILDSQIDTQNKVITIRILGDELTEEQKATMSKHLEKYNLDKYTIKLIQGTENVLIDFFKEKNKETYK